MRGYEVIPYNTAHLVILPSRRVRDHYADKIILPAVDHVLERTFVGDDFVGYESVDLHHSVLSLISRTVSSTVF